MLVVQDPHPVVPALARPTRRPGPHDLLDQAAAAGATILKPAEKTPWGGYSGYFADLDGQVWEVALNPAWTINDDGTLTI